MIRTRAIEPAATSSTRKLTVPRTALTGAYVRAMPGAGNTKSSELTRVATIGAHHRSSSPRPLTINRGTDGTIGDHLRALGSRRADRGYTSAGPVASR